MACKYSVNGIADPLNTAIFQYIEDTSEVSRKIPEITKAMSQIENSPLVVGNNGAFFSEDVKSKEVYQMITHINDAAEQLFGARGQFMTVSKRGKIHQLIVNNQVMRSLMPNDDIKAGKETYGWNEEVANEYNTEDALETEEEQIMEDYKDQSDFGRLTLGERHNLNTVSSYIITNLNKEISRTERVAEDSRDQQTLVKLEVLRKNLKLATKREKIISDFYDFADYIVDKSEEVTDHMKYLADTYNTNFTKLSESERFKILNKMMNLRSSIQSFHDTKVDESLILSLSTALEEKMTQDNLSEDDMEGAQRIITALSTAASIFKTAEHEYTKNGIPAFVDILLSYAPSNVNEELDNKIAKVKKGQLSGYNRHDVRGGNFVQRFNPVGKITQEMLDLNILQLQEAKITRQSLITELRLFKDDVGKLSVYTDPIAYSNVASVRLFSKMLQSHDIQNSQKSIKLLSNFAPLLQGLKDYKGVGETNVEKLYEDIYEVIDHPVRNSKGEFEVRRIAALVQPTNINEFSRKRSAFIEKNRIYYNVPDSSEEQDVKDAFFKSGQGKQYLMSNQKWEQENTEAIPRAEEILNGWQTQLAEVSNKIAKYRQKDSPYEILQGLYIDWNKLDNLIKKSYRNGDFIGPLSQPKLSLYSNPKYKNMPQGAVKEYHTFVLEQMKEAQKIYGSTGMAKRSWDTFSYMLPGVRIGAFDKVVQDGLMQAGKEEFADGFYYKGTDTEYGALLEANGSAMRRIPQYYTNVVEAGSISKDITNSVLLFVDSANRFKTKSEIHGSVLMMDAALETRQKVVMQRNGKLKIDSQSGVSNKLQRKPGSETQSYKHWESYIDSIFYGINTTTKKDEITEDSLSMDKVGKTIISFTAIKMLGFNWMQAASQLLQDTQNDSKEGWAGQFYNRLDLHYARRIVYKPVNLAGATMESIAQPLQAKTKIYKFMEMTDALQEGERMFSERTGTFAKKHLKTERSAFMQQSAEYLTTAEKAIALAIAFVPKDKNGNVIETNRGLWDLLITLPNGRLGVDPNVANFDVGKFGAELHTLVRKTNQMKGSHDVTLLGRHPGLRFLQVFRKFMAPGYVKRYGITGGGVAADLETGGVFEGYYSTMFTALQNLFRGQGSSTMTKGERQEASRFYHDAVMHMLTYVGAGVALNLLKDFDDDDEGFDDWAGNFILYQSLRLRTELSQFLDPWEAMEILESPTAATSPIKDLGQFISALWDYSFYMLGADIDDKYIHYQVNTVKNNKGDLKVWKEFLDIVPLYSGATKTPETAVDYYKRRTE